MDIKNIFDNNLKWVQSKLDVNQEYFKDMAKGQSPEILYIGCADSRVSAEQIMGLEPGEVFVTRNVANLVVNNDLSSLSVIDYAVDHLKVKHVVVCGHYYCGGVKAAMGTSDLGALNPWLRNIRDVYRLHKTELDGISDEDAKYKRLVELNVQEQCINLLKTEQVQRAYSNNAIKIHGWVYDIASGKLIDLNIDLKSELQKYGSVFEIV